MVMADIARRIQLAAAAFRRLRSPFFQQRCIWLGTRMQVFSCLVLSVLLYGSEVWALTASQMERLEVFYRSCLRQILGWRRSHRHTNEELYAACRTDTLQTLLERRQLGWIGHLGRMGEGRLAKQMLYSTMFAEGRRRRVGRQTTFTQLTEQYGDLVHQLRGKLRARGYPRGTTWLDVCQNRAAFRAICTTVEE